MEMKDELILYENNRENCFRFLAGLLYFPETRFFEEENLFQNLLEGLRIVCPNAVQDAVRIEKSIREYTEEELQIDYAKLFKGPNTLLAPPYGSVYLDEGRQVMGSSTMEVMKTYEQEGLSKSDDFKDLPDHIVVELEFMSFLIYQELDALKKKDEQLAWNYLEKQNSFLNSFLHQWVPPFCQKIKEGTENKFYISLADCLLKFIKTPLPLLTVA